MNKNIKILLTVIAAALMLCMSGNLFSQSLQFCEDVNKDGAPINASTVFNISSKGGYLKCVTTLPYRIGTESVSYEIYKVDSDGNESYDNSIYQVVDPSWTWFWKEIIFYDEGLFNISVYDNDKNYLAAAQIRIQYN